MNSFCDIVFLFMSTQENRPLIVIYSLTCLDSLNHFKVVVLFSFGLIFVSTLIPHSILNNRCAVSIKLICAEIKSYTNTLLSILCCCFRRNSKLKCTAVAYCSVVYILIICSVCVRDIRLNIRTETSAYKLSC